MVLAKQSAFYVKYAHSIFASTMSLVRTNVDGRGPSSQEVPQGVRRGIGVAGVFIQEEVAHHVNVAEPVQGLGHHRRAPAVAEWHLPWKGDC